MRLVAGVMEFQYLAAVSLSGVGEAMPIRIEATADVRRFEQSGRGMVSTFNKAFSGLNTNATTTQ